MTDWTKLIDRLDPPKDGESAVHHRTGTVTAVNSDGTLDIDLGGVVVPSVATIHAAPVGSVVQILLWKGDLLALGAGNVGSWADWTPGLVATGASPTLGTGSTRTGRYVRLGNVVLATGKIQFGTSGTNAGSGTYVVNNLPVVGATIAQGNIGTGLVYDNSGNQRYTFVCQWFSANRDQFFMIPDGGSDITHALPAAWGANDVFTFQLMYEAA